MNVIQTAKMALKAREAQNKLKAINGVGTSKNSKVAVLINGLQELEEVKLDISEADLKDIAALEQDIVAAFNAAKKDLEPKLMQGMDKQSLMDLLG